jgi:two-component system phosphate regulon sensor histidine kinase PhoR
MAIGQVVDPGVGEGEPCSEGRDATSPGVSPSKSSAPDQPGRIRPPFRAMLRRGLLLLLAIILVMGVSGFGSVLVVTGRIDRLTQNLEPLASANSSLLEALLNADTGQRGYLLTRNVSFLVPYRQGMRGYLVAAATATRLVSSDPPARRLLRQELGAGTRWMDQYALPALRAAGADAGETSAQGGTSSSSTPSPAEGQHLLNTFRAANTALQRWLEGQIAAAAADSHSAQWALLATIALTAVAAIALGGAGARRLYRSVVPPLQDILRLLERQRHGEPTLSVQPTGVPEVQAVAREVNGLIGLLASTAQARAHREQLRAIATELGHRVSRRLAMDDLLSEAARRIGAALRADLAWILLDDESGSNHQWRSPTARRMTMASSAVYAALREFAEILGPGIHRVNLDPVAQSGESLALPASLRTEASRSGIRSVMICPLQAGDAQLGVLALGRGNGMLLWEETDVELTETITGDLVRAILNAQLYEKQRTMVQVLQELDRQKDEFVATVSHELRSPLTSVRGYLELLHDGDAGPLLPEQHAMVTTIQRSAGRLGVLIEDLLSLSRLESSAAKMRSEPVRVAGVLEQVLDAVRPEAERKRLELVSIANGDDTWICGDADALEQVLLNLAANAVKFTPEGGTVTMTQASAGRSVVVKVTDTGIGIPRQEQARLFERFFRASNATAAMIPGTGLGLHIVSRIVTQHSGIISVDSEAGRGATFTVTFPSIDAPS